MGGRVQDLRTVTHKRIHVVNYLFLLSFPDIITVKE